MGWFHSFTWKQKKKKKTHRKQYKPVIYYGLYMILEWLAALKAHICVVSTAAQCGRALQGSGINRMETIASETPDLNAWPSGFVVTQQGEKKKKQRLRNQRLIELFSRPL